MIRVVLYGGATEGRFNYKVWTENTRLASPLEGLSAAPLFDACRRLLEMGAAGEKDVIGLFDDSGKYDNQFRLKTTIGYGAKMTVKETGGAPRFVPYAPFPSGGAEEAEKTSEATDVAPEAEKPVPDDSREAVEATGAKSATREAAPPPRRTPPASPDDKGPVPPRPPKPGPTHHRPKPRASGGRRGQR